uniref:Battenin n=1 Tax=Acrobeloides nanus TaxID=290746 RepID=A0A914CPH9_9BILA
MKATTIENVKNIMSFWIFGLCMKYGFVIMLCASEDILNKFEGKNVENNGDQCKANPSSRQCNPLSTGTILLANMLPSVIINLTFPFFLDRIPF